jgi:hypothetical protein
MAWRAPPVIVWLIKKFFETREAIKHMMRDHSEMVFDRNYLLPGTIVN